MTFQEEYRISAMDGYSGPEPDWFVFKCLFKHLNHYEKSRYPTTLSDTGSFNILHLSSQAKHFIDYSILHTALICRIPASWAHTALIAGSLHYFSDIRHLSPDTAHRERSLSLEDLSVSFHCIKRITELHRTCRKEMNLLVVLKLRTEHRCGNRWCVRLQVLKIQFKQRRSL